MVVAREILNKLIWDKRYDLADYAIIFVHRGAPHDLKTVRASNIKEIDRSFFMIEEDTMIPFHRIRAIRNIKTGKDIYTRSGGVRFPLEEIQGHEELGEFEDKEHQPYPEPQPLEVSDKLSNDIQCGARLSFPENNPESFRERVKGGLKLGMIELSFFEYNAAPRISEKYQSITESAENVLLEAQLEVGSIHLPNVNILVDYEVKESLDLFLPFCRRMDCKSIVFHPGRTEIGLPVDLTRSRRELREVLEEVSSKLQQYNVTLSIETFPAKHRALAGATDISSLIKNLPPLYRIAYDTSHTIGDTDNVVEDIVRNIGKISLFHFSNRNGDERHTPIFNSKGDLDFTKIIDAIKASGFGGMIILEYQPTKYRMYLERDLKKLRSMIQF